MNRWSQRDGPLAEIRQLQARAAGELRSVGNYVGKLVVDDLRKGRSKRQGRARPLGEPGDRRVAYDLTVQLPRADREKLARRARDEMRTVGNYTAMLVVKDPRGKEPRH